MDESADHLADHLARIPLFASADQSRLVVRRLGGLTNVNHLIELDGRRYVLRIPGPGTGAYIDRRAEEVAARAAARAGVNAEVVFFDAHDGLMVTCFLEPAVTMSPARFRDLDAVGRAGRALRRLHDTSSPFATDFALFAMIDEYKALLGSRGATLPAGYDDVQAQAGQARRALEAHPVALVACHCDPLCENFLDDGRQMFVIDYEYAANNDPMWDLGDLSVEAGFDDRQDDALLRAYFDGDAPDDRRGRMVVYKAMCDLLWTLWGVIQHVNANPADDFWAYAVGRFERCRSLMGSAGFAEHLASIGGSGPPRGDRQR